MKVIYIAGFRQHAGKTLTSLGIISQLLKVFKPEEIGYIKPVGQELVTLPDGTKIDKDGAIVEQFALHGIDMKTVSPVRLGSGVTKDFLRSGTNESITKGYEQAILDALESMKDKKVVIAEGTGHPGVGGIVNLSSAQVAKLIGAEIIYLAGGGLGKTLDMMEVDFHYLQRNGAKIRGVVFNKLIPDKIDQMKELITEQFLTERFSLDGSPIRILGHLPVVDRLNKPSMALVYRKFPNAIVAGDINLPAWKMPSAGVKIISISHENFLAEEHIKSGDIVIISANSERRLKKVLEFNKTLPENDKIAGIIFTCTKVGIKLKNSIRMTVEAGVPGLFVPEDTSSADEKLYDCIKNTKLQEYDLDKFRQISELFENHFDVEKFKETFGVD